MILRLQDLSNKYELTAAKRTVSNLDFRTMIIIRASQCVDGAASESVLLKIVEDKEGKICIYGDVATFVYVFDTGVEVKSR